MTDRTAERMQRIVDDRAHLAPSTLLVSRDPEGSARVAARGDRGDGRAPDEHTAFRIASCTKSFTAARVLQLRDQGRLSLDDPISAHLPAEPTFPTADPDWPVPTVRQLLSMSGGLPTDDAWADRQESLDPRTFDDIALRGVRPEFPPGRTYVYSNLGYAWLGRACEVLDGRSFTEQVRAEILRPLQLHGTDFTPPRDRAVATGYALKRASWDAQDVSAPGAFSPIGGLFSTAHDLLAWTTFLASASDTPQAASVLAYPSRQEMLRPQQLIPSTRDESPYPAAYGYGLVIEDHPDHGSIHSHSGGYPGFSAHMRWHADSGAVVIGFENGRYSGVRAAVSAVLDDLVASHTPRIAPWPETVSAANALHTVLSGGGRAEEWAGFFAAHCDPVVAADDSADERAWHASHLLHPQPAGDDSPKLTFPSPSTAEWTLPGRGGTRVRAAIQLRPAEPPRVQRVRLAPIPR